MTEHTKKQKLWGGRFSGDVDPLMEKFNASITFDKRLYAADILGSQGYVYALQMQGIVTEEERKMIHDGLDLVKKEVFFFFFLFSFYSIFF